jgi:transcription elongation factor S-II
MHVVQKPTEFRNNISKHIYNIINNEKKSKNIEIGIYNFALDNAKDQNIVKKWENPFFVQLYIDRFKVIFTNIKDPIFLEKIISKKIRSRDIYKMTHQEMQPEKWKKLIEAQKIKDENRYAPKVEASTDNFTCWKCKSKKCTYYQLQTRSADEPMTTFVTCLDCGQRWKC